MCGGYRESGSVNEVDAEAVADALNCPYCIDACTMTLINLGVTEAEMSEAVHVAGAMAAGITLVHSVQVMNKVDQFGR